MRRSGDDATLGASLRPRGPIQLAVTTRYDREATVVAVSGELDVLTCSEGPVRRAIALARLTEALGVVSSLAEYKLLAQDRRLT
jgi:hypothetical protein